MGGSSSKPAVRGKPGQHWVTKNAIQGPFPEHCEVAAFGTGCFWGTEKGFWRMPGVWSTAVGYCNGRTAKPTYNQVCSGRTGHAEVVQVVYDPAVCAFADLLRTFWESHDPTQGDGQGNDRGSQYRSGIYCHDPIQRRLAEASRDGYQSMLDRRITTEILGSGTPDDPPPVFFFAEEYHQQYLARPGSRPYCSAQPTGHKLDPWGVWMPKDLTQEYSPKLPAAFWAKHSSRKGCSVVRASNEQVTLASLGAS